MDGMESMDKKKLIIGILAHVDAGKTTLAECMLYLCGSIRRAGRVDHGDTFLDTDSLERTRGITIFSKQAQLRWKETEITLLDTPGHIDFSAEMERTLQVLDYAVLVISGADGVQGHVMTLWHLLKRYRIPVFLFINKMDQPDTDAAKLLRELQDRLDQQCVDFTHASVFEEESAQGGVLSAEAEAFAENIAVCDERLMNRYLESGNVEQEEIAGLIAERGVFPCYFGSALKMEGVEALLSGISRYSRRVSYPDSFGARVYKIGRDAAGNRLTYLKVTGGRLQVRQTICGAQGAWEEKADQIRIYSGEKYTMEKEVPAGTVCVVTGLSRTFSGEGLGIEQEGLPPQLAPVMTYRILLPSGVDVYTMYKKLCQLEEEEPQLHIIWKEQVGEIHAQLMGEVQTEILKSLIESRYGIEVSFDEGSILYKETIRSRAEGVGHFEPLRHYAEVHLILEPGEAGSGLVFDTSCSEDMLDKNWQRLVLTHLEEREHPGILTGSPITDMKITLAAGKAHLKHTEGGDFRQATYRAVRQGLHRAGCVLLEPVYSFRLEVPVGNIGRAMSDIRAMCGRFEPPVTEGETAVLTGTAPVVGMRGYQSELLAYSGGRGRLYCSLKGYEPCHNAEEVTQQIGYQAKQDLDNPASSVFCAHGAGFLVEWDEVEQYMHLESVLGRPQNGTDSSLTGRAFVRASDTGASSGGYVDYAKYRKDEEELKEIFARTYGAPCGGEKERRKKPGTGAPKTIRAAGNAERADGRIPEAGKQKSQSAGQGREYLLVDGYNIIFAWEELRQLAQVSLDGARGKLMDILSNYQGYRKMTLILVFDAYKVKGSPGSVTLYHNIHVVYTKEAETADQYIEKTTHELGRKNRVTVATSDGLEQMIIMGQGAARMSAMELRENIMSTNEELRELFLDRPISGKQYLFDTVSAQLAEHLEEVRLGRKESEL